MDTKLLSNALMWGCRVGLVSLVGVAGVIVWFGITAPQELAHEMEGIHVKGDLMLSARLTIVFVMCLAVYFAFYTVLQAHRLFEEFRFGRMLGEIPARLIGNIGKGTFAMALVSIIAHPILSLLFTSANPVGQRSLSVSIGSSDIALLLIAGLMVLIGRAMQDAAALDAENKAFV